MFLNKKTIYIMETNGLLRKYAFLLLILFVVFSLAACNKNNTGSNKEYVEREYVEAGTIIKTYKNYQEKNDTTFTMEVLKDYDSTLIKDLELEEIKNALNLIYNYVYDDKSKKAMLDIQFINTDKFLGYEYKFNTYGDPSNPWCIEFTGMSKDKNYYLFWLYEKVHYDGEFHHAVTGNFYAVNKETKEIIVQRNGTMPDDWNDKFPQ